MIRGAISRTEQYSKGFIPINICSKQHPHGKTHIPHFILFRINHLCFRLLNSHKINVQTLTAGGVSILHTPVTNNSLKGRLEPAFLVFHLHKGTELKQPQGNSYQQRERVPHHKMTSISFCLVKAHALSEPHRRNWPNQNTEVHPLRLTHQNESRDQLL